MIEVKPCTDTNYIKEVIFDDEMWARCSDDYMVRSDEILESVSCIWLVCSKGGKNIGLASVHVGGNSVVDIHIYIPKQSRGKSSIPCGKAILAWIAKHANERVSKINTKVPVIYKDVIGFAIRLGFKREGIDSQSITKNGILMDRVCLGILREEVAI